MLYNSIITTSSNGNIFSLLDLCEGTGGFCSQRPVTRSFGVFFDLRLDIRLSKQPRRRWFERPSRSLRRHWNVLREIIMVKITKSPWQGDTFCNTNPLKGKSAGHRWIFLLKYHYGAELSCFTDVSLNKLLNKQSNHLWLETQLRSCDTNGMLLLGIMKIHLRTSQFACINSPTE